MWDAGVGRRVLSTSAVAALLAGLAACSSNSSASPSTGSAASEGVAATAAPGASTASAGTVPATVPAAAPATTGGAAAGAAPPASVGKNADPEQLDPAAFGPNPATGANQWFPLTPGYQSVREGAVNSGRRRIPHRRVYTVTDVSKEIDGVKTVIVLDQDFDGGEIAEQALDYLAEDSQGNVWYLGSYTEAYEGGQFVNANDAWLAGVNGGKAGVLMMADPQPGMPRYSQATVPGEGSAEAEVIKSGQSVCVPFNCYDGVLVIREDGSEDTYYAPGAGGIKLQPVSGDPQETEELVNLTQLTDQGLAELSDEALKLDEHARSEASDVFGDSSPAERMP